jgi:hypothetical protein
MARIVKPGDSDPTAEDLSTESFALPTPTVVAIGDLERMLDKMLKLSHGGAATDNVQFEMATKALNAVADEVGRTQRRSNAVHPGISVFSHPEGEVKHPKAPLKYETWFCSAVQSESQLTPTEIDLFNRFDGDKEAHDGTWTAALDKHGRKKRLTVTVPAKTIDHLSQLPPLGQILSELLFGSDVADPNKAMLRLHAAEQQIEELRAQLAKLVPVV